MALSPNATITWYRPLLLGDRDARRAGRSSSTRGSQPAQPASAPDAVDRCDLMLVTHGHFDHFGDALMIASRTRPIWPCIHEMSLWLGRNYAHKDALIGMNKGGTVEAAGMKVTMVRADHSAGDIYGGRRGADLPRRAGRVRRRARGRRSVLLRRRHGRLLGHAPDRRAVPAERRVPADRRPLHDGPGGAAMAVELLGVSDVAPMHGAAAAALRSSSCLGSASGSTSPSTRTRPSSTRSRGRRQCPCSWTSGRPGAALAAWPRPRCIARPRTWRARPWC